MPQLLPFISERDRLIEPFVGAGAVSLLSRFPSHFINDANPGLVSVCLVLRQRPKEFITHASSLFHAENSTLESYKRIRDEFKSEYDRFKRVVRPLYLNRFGFNGMYRVEKIGNYNDPFGYPAKLPNFPAEWLECAALKMESFEDRLGGYLGAFDEPGEGDVVYCDPPYLGKDSRRCSFQNTVEQFDICNFKKHRQCLPASL